MSTHSFRCYAYRKSEDRYIAYCLDLMLIGESTTMQAAIADLEDAIDCHVVAAHRRGWDKDLIPRPARPGRWLEYYGLLILHTIKALLGRFDDFTTFTFKEQVEGEKRLAYASLSERRSGVQASAGFGQKLSPFLRLKPRLQSLGGALRQTARACPISIGE